MLPQPRIIPSGVRPPNRRSRSQQPQSQLRLSQPPTHINNVPDPRPRSQQGPPSLNLPNHRHINQNLAPLRRIPASQHTPKTQSRPPQSSQKLTQPRAASQILRQRQTQQKAPRHPAHRRHIAHRPRQAFPAHGVRRMLVPQKVRPLQKPIARQNHLTPTPRPHQRRIVPHSDRNKLSATHFPKTGDTTPPNAPRIRSKTPSSPTFLRIRKIPLSTHQIQRQQHFSPPNLSNSTGNSFRQPVPRPGKYRVDSSTPSPLVCRAVQNPNSPVVFAMIKYAAGGVLAHVAVLQG